MSSIKRIFPAVVCALLMLTCGCQQAESEPSYSEPATAEVNATEPASTSPAAESSEPPESSEESVSADSPVPTWEAPSAPVREPDTASFDERLAQIRDECSAEGVSVALFSRGKIIHTANLGLADRELGIPADDNTRYRCASVSKLVTAMILMQLYDEGIITPETPLEEATGLPFGSDVKLWNLMTHTAGLTDSAAYLEAPSKYYSADYVLNCSKTGYAAGEVYSYTNCGAGLMGAVIEKLTGEFFHDYAADSFFSRLGMDAGYVIDRVEIGRAHV